MTSLIYRLVDGSGLVYIGSTDLTLELRKQKHLTDYKRWTFGKVTKTSWFDVLDADKIEIELVEICNTNNRWERETWYLRNTENINILKSAKLTIEERSQQRKDYHIKNREKDLISFKNYYTENKEKIQEIRCQVITCICGKTYQKNHKARHEKSNFHLKNI
jgi:hypothetical protein